MGVKPPGNVLRWIGRALVWSLFVAATLFAAWSCFLIICSAVTNQQGEGMPEQVKSLGPAAAVAVVVAAALGLWLAYRSGSKVREEDF